MPTEVASFTENEIYILYGVSCSQSKHSVPVRNPGFARRHYLKPQITKGKNALNKHSYIYTPWGRIDRVNLLTHWKRPWCWERSKSGGEGAGGGPATEDEMIGWCHWLNAHESEKFQEIVKDKEVWHAAVHGKGKESDVT